MDEIKTEQGVIFFHLQHFYFSVGHSSENEAFNHLWSFSFFSFKSIIVNLDHIFTCRCVQKMTICCLKVLFVKDIIDISKSFEQQLFVEKGGQVHFLNTYCCNLSICMFSQNAERVQIAVMKLFHYGDEHCWINRNNKGEYFIEPSVEVLWWKERLFLQHWGLAEGQKCLPDLMKISIIFKQNIMWYQKMYLSLALPNNFEVNG